MNLRNRMQAALFSLRGQAASGVFLLAGMGCFGCLAAPAAGADLDAAESTKPTPAVQLVALHLREISAGTPASPRRTPRRMGMHVVLRVAVADMVSHPDSGDFEVLLRSRLLHRSIARSPLAVGVTWRF